LEDVTVVIRGFEPARPRLIAAIRTEMLADAAGIAAGRTPVRLCADEAQLDDCLAMTSTPLVLVELGSQTSPLMLSRLMGANGATVIAVLPSGTVPVAQVISLALSGTRFDLVHDASEISAAIRQTASLTMPQAEVGEVVRALAWRLDRQSLEDVVGLLILGRRPTSVGDALSRLERTAAPLRAELRERSLPTPARLLGWGCALHLIWQMDRYGRDLAEVSRTLGFESSRQCSDAFKFHTGIAPMNALRAQGFEGILDEFVRRLGAHQAPPLDTVRTSGSYLRICA
jgi:hypothetical protein